MLVEQRPERAQNTALRLPAQSEQDEVVTRQNRVHQLGNHRVVVADDAGEQRFACRQLFDEIVADLVFHRAPRKRIGGRLARAAQIANRFDF